MNRKTIATTDGIFTLDASGHYVPAELAPLSPPALIAVWVLGGIAGWAAFVGASYALYQAVLALLAS